MKGNIKVSKRISKILLMWCFMAIIAIIATRGTYAWLEVYSQKGIYPYYEVSFMTPSSDIYSRIEVSIGEVFNAQEGDYELQYVSIYDERVNVSTLYPGETIYLRFAVINRGDSASSLSIYFKNIIDTRLTDPETGELLNKYLSENIVLGSTSFVGGNTAHASDNGFLFYASEQLMFTPQTLTSVEIPDTICSEEASNCYMNSGSILFAGNVDVPSSTLRIPQSSFNARIAYIEENSADVERDKENFFYEAYNITYLDWYMLLDRDATAETASAMFRIGTVLFSVD